MVVGDPQLWHPLQQQRVPRRWQQQLQCLVVMVAPVRSSTQRHCGPRGGDDGVRHGPAIESTQHEVWHYNPRGECGGGACTRWRRSPWWRVVVACNVCVVLLKLGSWQWLVMVVLAGMSPSGKIVLLRGCPP
jgi:hypothetical protein